MGLGQHLSTTDLAFLGGSAPSQRFFPDSRDYVLWLHHIAQRFLLWGCKSGQSLNFTKKETTVTTALRDYSFFSTKNTTSWSAASVFCLFVHIVSFREDLIFLSVKEVCLFLMWQSKAVVLDMRGQVFWDKRCLLLLHTNANDISDWQFKSTKKGRWRQGLTGGSEQGRGKT